MKKIFAKEALLAFFAAGLVFMGASAEELPLPPVFSLDSGFYDGHVRLEITAGEGEIIYYTDNGDMPTTSSKIYNGPIALEEETALPPVVQGRTPREEAPKAVVIRAAAANGSGQLGEVTTGTYFIGEGLTELYKLPIVSLVIDTKDLWDPEAGIYSNYDYEHNVPAYFKYFNSDGSAGPGRGVEVKVSGHGSRSSAKKSLRVYFTKGDISKGKSLDFNVIPGTRANFYSPEPVTSFSKLTFRISDWDRTDLRDPLAQKIGSFTRADVANSAPTALFLNGEFWGIYECREQLDEKYLEKHYGVDDDNIVFLDRDWTLDPQETILESGVPMTDKIEYEGPADANEAGVKGETYYRRQWLQTRELAESKDITDPHVYAQFCERVDIDNFIDFAITYIYAANDDWPGNNFKFWRVTDEAVDPNVYGADGKWRFMIHDFDIAFDDPWHDTLYLSALHDGSYNDTDAARHPAFSTRLLGSLLKNKDFRDEFSQRTLAYLYTAMSETNVNKLIDSLANDRRGAKLHDLLRWDIGWGPVERKLDSWERNLSWLKRFAAERPQNIRQQYMELLNETYAANITGTARMAYYTTGTGTLSINGVEVTAELYGDMTFFGGEQFAGIPLRIRAYDGDKPMTISVANNGITTNYVGEAVFTPEPGAGYTVIIS